MKQRHLASIINPQKQDLSLLLPQIKLWENYIELIEQKHDRKRPIYLWSGCLQYETTSPCSWPGGALILPCNSTDGSLEYPPLKLWFTAPLIYFSSCTMVDSGTNGHYATGTWGQSQRLLWLRYVLLRSTQLEHTATSYSSSFIFPWAYSHY